MTSQLNVDTIVDKAGSGGTNVKVANNAVAVAEGGSATTTVVQGLAKSWVLWNQSSPEVYDSLNISSMTDSSTGLFDMNVTNAMGSTNYVCNFNATVVNSHAGQSLDVRNAASDTSASLIEVFYTENNSAQDSTRNNLSLLGDLA
tara:strand:- start:96 stop:530 length:435 start_codon:yes stop_codon:yes gene_type:complete